MFSRSCWLGVSELCNFGEAQLPHGVVRSETEVPIAEKKVLDFLSAFIACRVITQLVRVMGNLENQCDDFFCLAFGLPTRNEEALPESTGS